MPFPSTVAPAELITSQWGNDVVETLGNRLALAGGTMTGHITLVNADPSNNNHATRKLYVDQVANTKLSLAGGTMTGLLRIQGSSGTHLALDRDAGASIAFRNAAGSVNYGRILGSASNLQVLSDTTSLVLGTDGAERLRIAGNITLWNKASSNLAASGVEIGGLGTSAGGSVRSTTSAAGLQNVYCRHESSADANGQTFIQFVRTTAATIGSIAQNGTTGVNFNTTSDYRLKDVLGEVPDALARLRHLGPKRIAWKADGSLFDGMIAHVVAEVAPWAVTGEKDAMTVDDDGNEVIDPQQVDYAKLVPLLAAAVLELADQVVELTA